MAVISQSIKDFGLNLIRHPKTTAMGIAAIATGVLSLGNSPMEFLSNENAILALLVGVGLLFSADAKP